MRKPSTPKSRIPRLVDLDHALHHPRVFGEEVVEAEEVAVQRVLADERGVPAVVVDRHVVEPRRDLEVLLAGLEHRRVGEAGARAERFVGAEVRVDWVKSVIQ
jgi:hypothetical protein